MESHLPGRDGESGNKISPIKPNRLGNFESESTGSSPSDSLNIRKDNISEDKVQLTFYNLFSLPPNVTYL